MRITSKNHDEITSIIQYIKNATEASQKDYLSNKYHNENFSILKELKRMSICEKNRIE